MLSRVVRVGAVAKSGQSSCKTKRIDMAFLQVPASQACRWYRRFEELLRKKRRNSGRKFRLKTSGVVAATMASLSRSFPPAQSFQRGYGTDDAMPPLSGLRSARASRKSAMSARIDARAIESPLVVQYALRRYLEHAPGLRARARDRGLLSRPLNGARRIIPGGFAELAALTSRCRLPLAPDDSPWPWSGAFDTACLNSRAGAWRRVLGVRRGSGRLRWGVRIHRCCVQKMPRRNGSSSSSTTSAHSTFHITLHRWTRAVACV